MFRKGDMVWSFTQGWGVVTDVEDLVSVKFDKGGYDYYEFDGRRFSEDINRDLFFCSFMVPSIASIRPQWRAKKLGKYFLVGTYGYITSDMEEFKEHNDRRWECGNYFQTEEEAMESKFYKVFNDKD